MSNNNETNTFTSGPILSPFLKFTFPILISMFLQALYSAAETSAAGKSIFQHDPKGKVAEAYKSLAKEVLADADRQRKLSSERAR